MDDIEKMLEKANQTLGELGKAPIKAQIMNIALALTSMAIQNNKKPKEVVNAYFETMKELGGKFI